jgi:hypothetical protein
MLIAYSYLDGKLSEDVLKKDIKGIYPYVLGVSALVGFYSFNFTGILYGPLLVCIIKIIIDMLS